MNYLRAKDTLHNVSANTSFKTQRKNAWTLVAIMSLCSFTHFTYSCTTVFANAKGPEKVVARSMDLYVSDTPLLVVSPRGIKRNGDAGENSLQWTSKYGTVVSTAFKTNTVTDGINEQGFSFHLLYLTSAIYEKRDLNLPAVTNALWGQYLLDNYSTVAEALKGISAYQVMSKVVFGKTWPIHLAIEDASGDAAVIEFIEGKRKVYHGPQYNIMTNEPAYNIQLENIKRYKEFGGQLSLPGDTDPLSRFVRVATFLKTMPAAQNNLDAIAYVLSVIRAATVPFGAVNTSGNGTVDAWSTRWISIANLTTKTYFFNSTTTPNIIWLELSKLNFSEGAPVLSIDPNDLSLAGEVSQHLSEQKH